MLGTFSSFLRNKRASNLGGGGGGCLAMIIMSRTHPTLLFVLFSTPPNKRNFFLHLPVNAVDIRDSDTFH